jgi:lysophospholipid acyltransferase (LPLAT)-like uncharacterized protein
LFERFKREGRNVILAFWHNQILFATFYFRNRGIVVMSSSHFDGRRTAATIAKFGYTIARGSSTRGGVKALLELRKRLLGGNDVGFTLDGPRGPRYKVKPGPLWLSQKTGAPVVPFHIEPQRFWALKSWDRFRIPKPFSPMLVKIGAPFIVPPESDLEAETASLQRLMDGLREYCASYWKKQRPTL